jgi:hypothetical protein
LWPTAQTGCVGRPRRFGPSLSPHQSIARLLGPQRGGIPLWRRAISIFGSTRVPRNAPREGALRRAGVGLRVFSALLTARRPNLLIGLRFGWRRRWPESSAR